jgi:hypothetical protein
MIKQLQEAFTAFLANDQLRREMGENARSVMAMNQGSAGKTVRLLLTLIQE